MKIHVIKGVIQLITTMTKKIQDGRPVVKTQKHTMKWEVMDIR